MNNTNQFLETLYNKIGYISDGSEATPSFYWYVDESLTILFKSYGDTSSDLRQGSAFKNYLDTHSFDYLELTPNLEFELVLDSNKFESHFGSLETVAMPLYMDKEHAPVKQGLLSIYVSALFEKIGYHPTGDEDLPKIEWYLDEEIILEFKCYSDASIAIAQGIAFKAYLDSKEIDYLESEPNLVFEFCQDPDEFQKEFGSLSGVVKSYDLN